jgi:hypothetical protein
MAMKKQQQTSLTASDLNTFLDLLPPMSPRQSVREACRAALAANYLYYAAMSRGLGQAPLSPIEVVEYTRQVRRELRQN